MTKRLAVLAVCAKLCVNLLEFYSHISAVTLQSKLLKKATSMLAAEQEQNKIERDQALEERVPPLKLSGLPTQELQVFSWIHFSAQATCRNKYTVYSWMSSMGFFQELCKELHRKIDVVDEARYDLEMKVTKNETEVMVLLCWTTFAKDKLTICQILTSVKIPRLY